MSNVKPPEREAPYIRPETLDAAKTASPRTRRTERGHVHAEAFCLMWYACRDCGAKERIWNSRDGVTPFGMSCASCGSSDMLHEHWGLDVYAPEHKLRDGQRFWRDGTAEEAIAFTEYRADRFRATHPISPETMASIINDIRNGRSTEFRLGWPMLDTFRDPSFRLSADMQIVGWRAVAHDHSERLKVVTAERDRMRAMLVKLAGECAECGGSGEARTDTGMPRDVVDGCPDCADIRAAIGEAS